MSIFLSLVAKRYALIIFSQNVAQHVNTTLIIVSLCVFLFVIQKRKRTKGGTTRTPPKATGAWPLLGHLHHLAVKVPAHRVLGDMADKYGPIFTIKLGTKPTLVVSSWEVAKECLSTNDKTFLTRPCSTAAKRVYGGALFGLGPHGPYWRNMRRISTHELLSNARLHQLTHARASELTACINHLFSLCSSGTARVDMGEWFSHVVMNVMVKMIAGKRYGMEERDEDSRRFVRAMNEFVELIGTFVLSDVVPFTEWMDLHGHAKAVKRATEELDGFISEWFEEHVQRRREGKVKDDDRDFMDVMLSTLEHDPSLSCQHSIENTVKATALNLIIGGAETTSVTVTWALALILNNSEVLKKAQDEIDIHVGKERWVEESDIKNMIYLVAIVKETLRLYVPLNVPREATEDCVVDGYHIPKGTCLIINIWKLHHDPQVWQNPDEFRPERFLATSPTYFVVRGNPEYIPFSYGKRSCPGISSAMQMSCLVLARVLQGFNLAIPNGQELDMTEGLGLTAPRATPLEVMLTPRLPNLLY